MRPLFFFALGLIFLLARVSFSQIIQQQIIPGELPDPSVIEVDGVYYVCGSSNDWGPVYPIYQSTDLQHWTFVTYVFQEPPAWTISSYWAPELFYRNGTFYCYYTARRTDGVSGIGVATTQNIQEGFEDQGQIIEWGDEAIDAFVYQEDSTLFITWKAYGLTPDKPIQILGSELTDDGLALQGEVFDILTADTDSWEDGGTEGQCIVENDGYLYMLYSGNACCGEDCNYQVGVARARTMRGPWEKYEGNPLLVGNDAWKCPGHGTALSTGEQWYYLYHAYPARGFPYLGRTVLLSQIYWDDETGWPFFSVDSTAAQRTILREDLRDNFSTGKLASYWRYDLPSYTFSTRIEDGRLTLEEVERSPDNPTGTALCVVPEYADFTVTTRVSERNEALKGLIFYATRDNSLGLGIRSDTLVLWKVIDQRFTVLNQRIADHPEGVFLRARVSDAHVIEFEYSFNGEQWESMPNPVEDDKRVVGDNLAWWSWGMKTGIFVKSDPSGEVGQAVFDDFVLEYNPQ